MQREDETRYYDEANLTLKQLMSTIKFKINSPESTLIFCTVISGCFEIGNLGSFSRYDFETFIAGWGVISNGKSACAPRHVHQALNRFAKRFMSLIIKINFAVQSDLKDTIQVWLLQMTALSQ